MRVEVAHQLGKEAVVPVIDRCLGQLLGGFDSNVEIVDKESSWHDSVMQFSFTGRVGYISVPLAGTIEANDANVVIHMDLPPMVKNFIGEEKIQEIVETNVREMLTA
jgi:hypothetical protein